MSRPIKWYDTTWHEMTWHSKPKFTRHNFHDEELCSWHRYVASTLKLVMFSHIHTQTNGELRPNRCIQSMKPANEWMNIWWYNTCFWTTASFVSDYSFFPSFASLNLFFLLFFMFSGKLRWFPKRYIKANFVQYKMGFFKLRPLYFRA